MQTVKVRKKYILHAAIISRMCSYKTLIDDETIQCVMYDHVFVIKYDNYVYFSSSVFSETSNSHLVTASMPLSKLL